MTPLSVSLVTILKHRDGLQKLAGFCSALHPHGFGRPSSSSCLWRRSCGATSRTSHQLLGRRQPPPATNCSMCTNSPSSCDVTNRLWSVYNKTKQQTEDFIPILSKNSVNPDTMFANNEMSLGDIEIYGFDYDYTLAFYSRHLHTLIFNIARDILVTKHRYPEGLREYEYIPNFAVRGLHYDVQKALLMKIDAFHYIQLGTVYRGLHPVPDEEVIAMYEGCHVPLENMSDFYGKSSHGHTMKQYMDIFSLPEMTLLSCVNDFFMRHNIDYEPVHLYKDVKIDTT
ncbi:5'-nucleotidase domain-containing protein 3-like [Diretmus argenteus]